MSTVKESIKKELISMLESYPIHQIKVKELTRRVGISRTTFYQYYDSVYSVLQEISDEFVEHLIVNIRDENYPVDDKYLKEPHPRILKGLEYLKENARTYLVLLSANGDPMFQRKARNNIADIVISKLMPEDVKIESKQLLTAFIQGGHDNMICYWLSHDTGIDTSQMAIINYCLIYSVAHSYPQIAQLNEGSPT